jgi:hypothetical protein
VTMTTDAKCDPRCREAHPAHITIAGKKYIRGDAQAASEGISRKTFYARIPQGMPHTLFANILYVPEEEYGEYIAGRILIKGQPPRRRSVRQVPLSRSAKR